VTHDVHETLSFARVVVVDGGRVVEDGAPRELLERDSVYRAMVDAERRVRDEIWDATSWRRMRIEDGRLVERSGP
jgi:energy-coupling factor transporter ATP-binding protein EcfA2